MPARKKWRVLVPSDREHPNALPSERAAYEVVDEMRTAWVSGTDGVPGRLTVQVDEGFGWTPYEHIDFVEEGLSCSPTE